MFEIFYKKNDNKKLFESLEKDELTNITKIQNYIPIYNNFFNLSENNYNAINLDNKYTISDIVKKKDETKYTILVNNQEKEMFKKESFFKFSPLLDPIKYVIGKYSNMSQETFLTLPSLSNNCHKKILDVNNSGYVDSFFSYLTSKLLYTEKYENALDFYGSFLGIKNDFILNIGDELEDVYDSTYFHDNKDVLFDIEEIDDSLLDFIDTSKRKKRLKMNESLNIKYDNFNDKMFDNIFELTEDNLKAHDINNKIVYQSDISNNLKSEKFTNSTCSSRTSHTISNDDDSENDYSVESCSKNSSDIDEYSSMSDTVVECKINQFPIQTICLERMDDTLDSLLGDDLDSDEEEDFEELTNDEWRSCLFQIIMSLVVYQKCFDFTHNDLHTNNIMYKKTEKRFLNYKYNGVYYKVPTFGKIYKIIDFGRAIYRFKDQRICSDSYHKKGDASTQYNCEPYFNDKKPRLNPNKSFDLCRLACALYDYFVEEDEDEKNVKDPIARLIIEWCKDDKGRNILYKSNGEERYPEFKLYKMIVRTVHNHTPEKFIEHPLFQKFVSSRKKIGKKKHVMNIDSYPVYFT
jgi:hypothetical protein